MTRRFHFISGLPRSGSTLLSAILRQNPRFHADMSGPLCGAFNTLQGELSGSNEYAVFVSDAQRQRMLASLFESYYGPEYEADVVFDTNRGWCAKMRHLRLLFPHGKVIACVRHMSWIIDSVEQLVRKNTLLPSSLFNYQPGGTVYSRADALANGEGLVGGPYNALKEAFYGDEAGSLMLLQYETLVSDPARAIAAVYDFIGETPYAHDLDNISYQADEFDQRVGTPGLHEVRRKIAVRERMSVLPPDVFRRFENDAFWLDPSLNPRGVRVV
ncbi:sulfotransferase [Luteibacter pinisoli]|uniref:Sulfotransferase n=1 Tax=Luteibacter pinisoli TaxID=2589080 RepID=A0A4Y5ZA81_9GAMM|nr:sulfotransferase [Luteibacter pinisoli]QDE41028.1 sulfotransferase [Luteibacter pinisoli]